MAKIIRVWDGTQWQEVGTALPNALSTDGTQTLTNKTINLTSNTLTGTTAQFNTALSDGNFTTLAGTETLTNKTISGADNTLTNIPNNALTNSAITINGSAVSLGGSTTISGLPTQTSNSGKYLTTDGSSASWSDVIRIVPPDSSISVPGASTSVSATGGDAQATVSFVAPTDNGGSTILGYTVISSPGNIKKSGSSSPITITGLTNGTAYTFTVKAHNIAGSSIASSASSSVTPTANISIDYLVVAGGGGGGFWLAGGGGAGGLRSTVTSTGGGGSLESQLLAPPGSTFTVTVGSGGSAASSARGNTGSNSTFSTITSIGGGGGATYGTSPGASTGGSGGGGAHANETGAAGTVNQGYAGGNGFTNAWSSSGGGGGGAGSVGGNGSNGTFGNAGSGLAISITGSSITYAQGGRGGAGNGASGGSSYSGQGEAGASNTGTGGGGGGSLEGTHTGGNGGSGVVILRTTQAATATTGSPTYTTSGGNHIYQFTSSGSITF